MSWAAGAGAEGDINGDRQGRVQGKSRGEGAAQGLFLLGGGDRPHIPGRLRPCSSSRQCVTAATEARLSSEWPASRSSLSSMGGWAKETRSPTCTSWAACAGKSPISTSRFSSGAVLPLTSGGSRWEGGWTITPGKSCRPWTVTSCPGRTRGSSPPISVTRSKPSLWPVTIMPMASMWAASSRLGRGSGPLPRFRPCRLPRRLVVVSSTSGCQAASIKRRTGAS